MTQSRIAILSVGDELVLGQTEDTNASWLARRIPALGVMAGERRTVGDDQSSIAQAIVELSRTHTAVIVTGGLGPTLDDLTREALADAMALASGEPRAPLEEDSAGIAHLRSWFEEKGRVMPPLNRRQALRPRGTSLLANPNGTAPGLATLSSAPLRVFCLPGPPREMQPMFDAEVAPQIAVDGAVVLTAALHTVGLGESALAGILGELMERSRMPSVGTTAKTGIVTIRIRAEGNAIDARRALDATVDACRARVSNIIFGRDEDTLESSVGALLLAQGATLASAESCTGGLVSARLTDVSGSSAWFNGGFVVYANARKTEDLGVPSSVLDEFGAVSHATAVALARGALRRTTSDYAISTTGVAGPTGGSPEKPVGTVFIAIADRARAEVCSRRFQMTGSRQTIRERSTVMALAALRVALLDDRSQSLLWAESERAHVEPL